MQVYTVHANMLWIRNDMEDNILFEELRRICKEDNVLPYESMACHTSIKAGGKCRAYVTPDDMATFVELVVFLRQNNIEYFVAGNGSNLLVSDAGFKGVVISLGKRFSEIVVDDDMIYAHAGALLSVVGRQALTEGLTGFEFASGIPGSVGGAVYMNAGAYGGEIKDIIEYADVYDGERIRRFTKDELDMSYRRSLLTDNPGYICLLAAFKLKKGDKKQIEETMKDLAKRRRDKQPLEYPSCGSTFKRPAGDFAGRLIEEAGLSGLTKGGMQVSTKHCGFIINHDGGTASDFYELAGEVIRKVEGKSGVRLELEVKLLGFDE